MFLPSKVPSSVARSITHSTKSINLKSKETRQMSYLKITEKITEMGYLHVDKAA